MVARRVLAKSVGVFLGIGWTLAIVGSCSDRSVLNKSAFEDARHLDLTQHDSRHLLRLTPQPVCSASAAQRHGTVQAQGAKMLQLAFFKVNDNHVTTPVSPKTTRVSLHDLSDQRMVLEPSNLQPGHYLALLCKDGGHCTPPSPTALATFEAAVRKGQCGTSQGGSRLDTKCKEVLFSDTSSSFLGITYPLNVHLRDDKTPIFSSGDYALAFVNGADGGSSIASCTERAVVPPGPQTSYIAQQGRDFSGLRQKAEAALRGLLETDKIRTDRILGQEKARVDAANAQASAERRAEQMEERTARQQERQRRAEAQAAARAAAAQANPELINNSAIGAQVPQPRWQNLAANAALAAIPAMIQAAAAMQFAMMRRDCFLKGSLVETSSSGSLRDISALTEGKAVAGPLTGLDLEVVATAQESLNQGTMIEILIDNNPVLSVTPNHPVLVFDEKAGKIRFKPARELDIAHDALFDHKRAIVGSWTWRNVKVASSSTHNLVLAPTVTDGKFAATDHVLSARLPGAKHAILTGDQLIQEQLDAGLVE